MKMPAYNKLGFRIGLSFVAIFSFFGVVLSQEDDPQSACDSGIDLYIQGDRNAAYPQIEDSVDDYLDGSFDPFDNLGYCAPHHWCLLLQRDTRSRTIDRLSLIGFGRTPQDR